MRIVLLTTVGIERPSGLRHFQIARALVRRGHQVRIIALHPEFAACRERRVVRDGVEVWYVGQMHTRIVDGVPQRLAPAALLRVLLGSTLRMAWAALASPADVYHLGKPQPINGAAALLALLPWRAPLFVDCDDDETTSNRFGAAWQRAVFAFWQWLVPRLCVGATANTRFLEDRLRAAGVPRVAYVPNGIEPALLHAPPAAAQTALRAALNLADKLVVGYLGALTLQNHPVDLLLDAFALLAKDLPDAVLLLIGGGADQALLQRRVAALGLAERVIFTGPQPRPLALRLLALADLSVDPVRADPVAAARSPLKLFESMALGVPLVTAPVGDRAALLGAAGVFAAPADPAALAAALAALLSDPQRRQALALIGRQRAQAYAWDALAANWEQVYTFAAL